MATLSSPQRPGAATASATAAYAACYALTAALQEYVDDSLSRQGSVLNPFDPFQITPGATTHMPKLSVGGPPNQTNVAAGNSEAYGRAIAAAILKKFPDTKGRGTSPVKPFGKILKSDEWRDTGTGGALIPRWGQVPLFLLDPVTQPTTHYAPTDIPGDLLTYDALLKSPLYAGQLSEVRRLGSAHSTERSAEQTRIAFFWANDLNGTYKPPGQLYPITQDVAKKQKTMNGPEGLLETARLFAMVGTAMVNASIVAWRAKYDHPKTTPLRLWRPESAIQSAATGADPGWQPLSAMMTGVRFSPNFPAYVSGHSTFGAAHAAAMKAFFRTDNIAYTATTEDPHAARDENGVLRTRSFTSFSQAALENGRSRVYLGGHYQFDASGGYDIGTRVGRDTAARFKETPADYAGDGGGPLTQPMPGAVRPAAAGAYPRTWATHATNGTLLSPTKPRPA